MTSPIWARRQLLAAAAASAALSHLHTSAQTHPPAQAQPPIIVTANPLGSADAPTPSERIDGLELKLRGTASLGEALDALPGVASSGFAPAAARPVIRGLDGERIRILRNGSASLDASGLSADHGVPMNLLAVESIEVVRGPAALLYGGNAIGGVVNVQDARIHLRSPFVGSKLQTAGAAEVQWASGDASRAAAFALDLGNETYTLHTDAASRRAADTKAPIALDCKGQTQRRTCNSAAKSDELAFAASTKLGDWRLGASVAQYSANYGTVAEEDVTIGMRQRRNEAIAQWEPNGGWIKRWRTQASYSDYAHTEFEGADPGTQFAKRGSSLRTELVTRALPLASGQWESVWGAQWDRERFSADGEEAFAPYSQSSAQALFTLQQWRGGIGQLTAGLHLQSGQVRSDGHPILARFVIGERSFSPRNLALGWVSPSTQGSQLSANLARAQRAPTEAELFANGPHVATAAYELGDASLGVERATHTELGLKWRSAQGHSAQAQIYRTRYAAHIAFAPTGNTRSAEGELNPDPATTADILPEWAAQSVPARFTGWELQGVWAMQEHLKLHWRTDRVRAVNLLTQEPMPRLSPMRLGAALHWQRGASGFRLGADRFAAQNAVPTGDRAVAGYTLWHASANHTSKWQNTDALWFAKLDNIGNTLAYSASSVLTQTAPGRQPLAGRSLRLGLQLGW